MLKVFADKTRLVFFARGRMTAEAGTQRINHDEYRGKKNCERQIYRM